MASLYGIKYFLRGIFLSIGIFCLSSCHKDFPIQVTFHGKVTYQCDGSPVKGLKVEIVRGFDTGREGNSHVGDAITDGNGQYYLDTKVEREGSFRYYELITTGYIDPKPPYFIVQGIVEKYRGEDLEDVEINTSIPSYRILRFHIKNISPVDSSDLFKGIDQVIYYYSNPVHSNLCNVNLSGESIDTTIIIPSEASDTLHYEYYFKKNGQEFAVNDSVLTICNDTLFRDIFY